MSRDHRSREPMKTMFRLGAVLSVAMILGWAGASSLPAIEPAKARITELEKVAASMKPGAWAVLETKGYSADLLRAQSHHILDYTGAAVWDPSSQQVLFVGQGHYSAL